MYTSRMEADEEEIVPSVRVVVANWEATLLRLIIEQLLVYDHATRKNSPALQESRRRCEAMKRQA